VTSASKHARALTFESLQATEKLRVYGLGLRLTFEKVFQEQKNSELAGLASTKMLLIAAHEQLADHKVEGQNRPNKVPKLTSYRECLSGQCVLFTTHVYSLMHTDL
jgi:hypothetical protein